jgi:SAM-dependent methyltransferase
MKPVESSWRQDALGQYIQSQEQVFCDQVVGNIFGFNALQLGMLEADLLKNCRIPYKIKLSEYQGDVYCDAEQLPIADNTIDLMLLPHVLDFSGYPQQALREAERVLVPEGYLGDCGDFLANVVLLLVHCGKHTFFHLCALNIGCICWGSKW